MKKYYFLLFGLSFFTNVEAQIINFPDLDFKNELLKATQNIAIAKDIDGKAINIDSNFDGEIEADEALKVVTLFLYNNPSIDDITGISYFTNLKFLYCSNIATNNFDVTSLLNLEELETANCGITNIKINGLQNLEYLYSTDNEIENIDFSGLVNLKRLSLIRTKLTSVDLSQLKNLELLFFYKNLLIDLNLSGLTNLISVSCGNHQLKTIELSGLVNLNNLMCGGNQLVDINLKGLDNLEYLNCEFNLLTSLDLSGLDKLQYLYCHNNQLQDLDVSNLILLDELYCGDNKLSNLDLNGLTSLASLQCDNNDLNSILMKDIAYPKGREFDVMTFSNNPNLTQICVNEEKIDLIQNIVNEYGYVNCVVDSKCSLSNEKYTFEREIRLYPNPTASIINLDLKNEIKVSSVSIYNTLGQLVLAIPNANQVKTVDVSSLTKGNYFIKLNTEKGIVSDKFVKK